MTRNYWQIPDPDKQLDETRRIVKSYAAEQGITIGEALTELVKYGRLSVARFLPGSDEDMANDDRRGREAGAAGADELGTQKQSGTTEPPIYNGDLGFSRPRY